MVTRAEAWCFHGCVESGTQKAAQNLEIHQPSGGECRYSVHLDMCEEQKVRSLLIADVRDVAAAHLAARRATPGQRFIVSTEASSLCL